METMTEVGTEKRVDELSKRVDFGLGQMDRRVAGFKVAVDRRFEQVDKRFDRFEASMKESFGEVNERIVRVEGEIAELRSDTKSGFGEMHKLMIRLFAGTLGSIIAGVLVTVLSHS
jgi:tetrahydromethanopterin S-methyltransferase subunit G